MNEPPSVATQLPGPPVMHCQSCWHPTTCLCSCVNGESRGSGTQVNAEIVTVQQVRTAAGEAQLRALLTDHVEKTGALLC